MRLTTKGRYAVTAMLDLVLHTSKRNALPVVLADISERQGISVSYLEQLFSKLRRVGLVRSIRGPGGGYLLAKSSKGIFVADIIAAVDEKVDVTRCGGGKDCQQGNRCLTHHLWHDLSKQIRSFLSDISLADLVEKRKIAKANLSNRQNKLQKINLQLI